MKRNRRKQQNSAGDVSDTVQGSSPFSPIFPLLFPPLFSPLFPPLFSPLFSAFFSPLFFFFFFRFLDVEILSRGEKRNADCAVHDIIKRPLDPNKKSTPWPHGNDADITKKTRFSCARRHHCHGARGLMFYLGKVAVLLCRGLCKHDIIKRPLHHCHFFLDFLQKKRGYTAVHRSAPQCSSAARAVDAFFFGF